ncbi:hypothetical protein [Massilia sp. BHUDP2]|uniref:hypothetical protein n=1 Tax=Massilia sp. BHUDP2 TaxID=3034505 RepID=UPI003905EC70
MTNSERLHAWIGEHMPEIAQDLACRNPALFRARLNALTGAQVCSCDTIEDGSARFLAALRDLTGEL